MDKYGLELKHREEFQKSRDALCSRSIPVMCWCVLYIDWPVFAELLAVDRWPNNASRFRSYGPLAYALAHTVWAEVIASELDLSRIHFEDIRAKTGSKYG